MKVGSRYAIKLQPIVNILVCLSLVFSLLLNTTGVAFAQEEPPSATPEVTLSAGPSETPQPTATEMLSPEATSTATLEMATSTLEASPTQDLSATPTWDLSATPSETVTLAETATETPQPAEDSELVDCSNLPIEFVELCKEAQQKGRVRVVIEFATAGRGIQSAQDQVLEQLSSEESQFEPLHTYETLPAMSLVVDDKGLEELVTSDLVNAIYIDGTAEPHLSDSASIVGATQAWASSWTGAGQTIAILDTGVDDDHPFLTGKVVAAGCFSMDYLPWGEYSLCPGYSWGSSNINSADPDLCPGQFNCNHGTHVAGIAAGKNGPGGMNGIAPDANIIAMQVFTGFDLGGGNYAVYTYYSDVVAALERVYTMRHSYNIAAVNLSLGGGVYQGSCDGFFPPLTQIVNTLRSAGIAVVFSAGNDGNAGGVGYPACISSVISVGSTDKNDSVSGFSNSHANLDIFAPGASILSSVQGAAYQNYWGTSMAAPHVAGAWALYKQKFPSASVGDVLSVFQSTGTNILDHRNGVVKPRIQIDAALGLAALVAPENDDDFRSFEITAHPFVRSQSTLNATLQVNEAPHYICGVNNAASVWYEFEPAYSGYYEISTAGSNYDTVLHVFEWAGMAQKGCNDDVLGGGSLTTSKVSFYGDSGVKYLISVTANNNGPGGQLNFQLNSPAPENDLRANAITVTSDFYDVFDTSGATISPDDPKLTQCYMGQGAASVWFKFVAPSTGRIMFDTWGSSYDTAVAVWKVGSGSNLTAVACDDQGNWWDGDGYDMNDNTSHGWNIPVSAGTYLIEVVEWVYSLAYDASEEIARPEAAGPAIGGDLALRFFFSTPLATPALTTPANYLTNNTTPTLSWNATNNAWYYNIQIDRNQNFNSPEMIWVASVDTFYTIEPEDALGEGKWYWRVRAHNDATMGSWSQSRAFTVDTTPPSFPVLTTPANNPPAFRGTPLHKWNSVATAAMYQLQYDISGGGFSTPVYDTGDFKGVQHKSTTFSQLGTFDWRVRAQDAAGNWSAWSEVRTFSMVAPIPVAPMAASPANNALTNETKPELSWAGVQWGHTYQIQIDNNSNFSSPEYDSTSGVGELSYMPDLDLADGRWYWRVRAWNENSPQEPGVWSATRNFTVDTTPPVSPNLNKPADNAFVQTIVPRLEWLRVTGANMYRLQVSSALDFSSPSIDIQTSAITYQIPAAQALDFAPQYWRVQSRDAAGNWSSFSAPRTLMVSLLSFPKNTVYIFDSTPLLQWLSRTGAIAYQLQVDEAHEGDFATPIADETLTTLKHNMSDLDFGSYVWRVRVETSAGWSSWMAPWTFVVTVKAPGVPVFSAPTNSVLLNTSTPELVWSAVPDAHTYELQIDNQANFSSPELNQIGLGTNYTVLSSLPEGRWYWRIRAVNEQGLVGTWSSSRNFIVDTVAPAQPSMTTPVDAASVVGTPQFRWSTSAGSATYQLLIDVSGGDFSAPLYVSAWNKATSVTPPANVFSSFGMFDWKVCAQDAAGNQSDCSVTRSLTINAPAPAIVVLTAPVNNASIMFDLPTFTWAPAYAATGYLLEVASNSKFISPVISEIVATNSYTVPLENALLEGKYFWRVQSLNHTSGPWSAVRTFTVDLTSPSEATLTAPEDGATVVGTPAFKWLRGVAPLNTNCRFLRLAAASLIHFMTGLGSRNSL